MVVHVGTQAELAADDARHDGGDELVELWDTGEGGNTGVSQAGGNVGGQFGAGGGTWGQPHVRMQGEVVTMGRSSWCLGTRGLNVVTCK